MTLTFKTVPQDKIQEVANTYGYRAPGFKKWTSCRCSSNHKTTATWIKCRLNFYHDNGENKHKPSIKTHKCSGKEPWLVIRKTYSGDYYTTHNGKSNNCGYFIYDVESFSSHRDALNRYHQLKTEACRDHFEGPSRCYSVPCIFVEPHVFYIDF